MINLLVVEDSPVFAEALLLLLHRQMKGDLKVVKVVDTAEKALQEIANMLIDLVLVDISLPKMSGIELIQTLQERCPGLPCLIVSGDNSSVSISNSLKAGARGYLIKDHASSIGEAIRSVLDGGLYISKKLQAF